MRECSRLGLALVGTALFGLTAAAQAKVDVLAGPQKPAAQAAEADVIFLGKVVEIEKDTVEATPYKGAPKDQRLAYKIAVVKIQESLLGGKGLTQFRVGFLADSAAAATPPQDLPVRRPPGLVGRPGRVGATVALTADMEGCFFLVPHHDGDFYILAGGYGGPLLKKDEKYAKELEEVKKVVKAIDDPVAALKAKDLDDRYQAAQIVLQRYQTVRAGMTTREPIPEAENKLIVALLTELPWTPDPAKPAGPSRSALWYLISPNEQGFKQPKTAAQRPGDPPVDFNKVMDEATTQFLKESGDKVKIRRYAAK